MKTGKYALMLVVLMLGASTVFAQGWRNAGRNSMVGQGNPGQGLCLNFLTDLTDEQQEKITELIADHQEEMAELRTKQRSTFEPVEKNKIRGEMLQKVQNHRDEISNLLTEDQKKQYNLLQPGMNCYGRAYAPRFRGNRRQDAFGGRGGRGFRGGL
jgi:Spy/CpxP family protein refolding chaperone